MFYQIEEVNKEGGRYDLGNRRVNIKSGSGFFE